MKKPSQTKSDPLFDSLIGLGSSSIRKTYYPGLKRFRALLDQSSDGIIQAEHPSGRIIDMNETARTFLDCRKTEADTTVFDLFCGSPEFEGLVNGTQDRMGCTYEIKDKADFRFFDVAGKRVLFENKTYLVFVLHDITDKEKLRRRIEESLKEKEVLLKEIHHRVKNNLQIVNSLLSLQEFSIKQDGGLYFLNDMKARVQAMALVHEQLYQSKEMHSVKLKPYVEELSSHLYDLLPIRNSLIRVEIDVEDLAVSVDQAIPIGLILNELTTNSYRHAFEGRKNGHIGIRIQRTGTDLVILFTNDGKPFSSGFSPRTSRTLGMTLVCALLDQLRGSLDFDGSAGARFLLVLPADLREDAESAGAPGKIQ